MIPNRVYSSGKQLLHLTWPFIGLAIINIWTFSDHYFGKSIFPADFVGGYHSMPYSWYADGGFFSPPLWTPYTHFGYPTHLSLQNSAFYLPVAFLDWLNITYTYEVAAWLQCLHVFMGGVGSYVFLRSKHFTPLVGFIGAVAYHLSSGFYSNGQHVDIVRGYAWLPWIFLVLSFNFLSQPGRWRLVVASLALFSFLAGCYPGMVVAAFYGNLFVCTTELWGKQASQIRQYLLRLLAIVGIALLIASVKFLPFIFLSENLEKLSPAMPLSKIKPINLIALFFRVGSPDFLPEDISLRTLFISPVMIVPLLYCLKRTQYVVVGIGLALLATFLAFDWVGGRFIDGILPGLKLSRLQILDYRGVLYLGLILASCDILNRLTNRSEVIKISSSWYSRLGIGIAITAILVGSAFGYSYSFSDIWQELIVLLVVNLLTFSYLLFRNFARNRKDWQEQAKYAYLVTCCTLVIVGSSLYNQDLSGTWHFQGYRDALSAIYQVPYDSIFSKSQGHRQQEWPQRPSRIPERVSPIVDLSRGLESLIQFNIAADLQFFSVEGYDNGNRLVPRVNLLKAEKDKDLVTFMTSESRVLLVSEGDSFSAPQLQGCIKSFSCGRSELGKVAMQSFGLESAAYQIQLTSPAIMVENELYYPGWEAEICADKTCRPGLKAQPFGEYLLRAWKLEPGTYTLRTRYIPPFISLAWLLFWIGVAISLSLLATDALPIAKNRLSEISKK